MLENKALKKPKTRETAVDGVKGLRIAESTQSQYWVYRGTFDGKKITKRLGSLNSLSKEEAIATVNGFNLLIQQGKNPIEEYLKKHNSSKFSSFVSTSFVPSIKAYKRSYKDDLSRINNYLLPVWGNLSIQSIGVAEVGELIISLTKTKLSNATINRVRSLISSIFKMAVDHDLIAANPVSRVKKLKENNMIERYLSSDELTRLVRVLDNPIENGIQNLVIVAAVKFLLLTGTRKRETLDLKWADLDLSSGLWTLKLNKSGKTRHINLSQDALSLVKMLQNRSDYVFANPETNLPFNDIRKSFDKIMSQAGITNMRIHDLRHNFASLAVNSGQSLYVVQRLLGHQSPQTTQRYAHLESKTLKDASERIADTIGLDRTQVA